MSSHQANRLARNDARIVAAAREVFIANPDAPISMVAKRAGVGISALYRRYAGKRALLSELCRQGLQLYIAEATRAAADRGDPWEMFAAFMTRIVSANTHAMVVRLAGRFEPDADLFALAREAQALNVRIYTRVADAGLFRDGVTVNDINLIGELLAGLHPERPVEASPLRLRYLQILLDGLRWPGVGSLPHAAPDWEAIEARWRFDAAGAPPDSD